MSFFQLVRREMESSLERLVFIAGLGGVSSASILAAINAGAQSADSGRPSLWAAALFIIALLLFIKTQNYILLTTTAEIEGIIHKVRLRLMDQVRRSELLPLDGIGRAEIVAAITKETTTLTQASNAFAFVAQGGVLIFFVAIYVAYLSLLAFMLSIVIVGLAAVVFHAKNRQLAVAQRHAADWENRLYTRLMDLLDGFKEVRLNSARSEDLYLDVMEVSRTAANIKIRAQAETFRRMILLQSAMYAMLGTIVFVVPVFTESLGGASVAKTVTALVFVIGACFGLVQSIPLIAAANASANHIAQLEAKLQTTIAVPLVGTAHAPTQFGEIAMRNVVFRYVERSSETVFKIGPIDFTLR